MPTYQLLRCLVALGGDKDNVVARHRGRPVVYPELAILQHLHGEDSVTEVYVVGVCDLGKEEMTQRLRLTYDAKAVEAVYPGTRPRLPTGDPDLPFCRLPVYVPEPTRPANPDPILRPIDALSPTEFTEVIRHMLPEETQPTDAEIARNIQQDIEEEGDGDLLAEFEKSAETLDLAQAIRPVVPEGETGTSRPATADQPQTRVSFRGQARQARPTSANLPDVSGVQPRKPEANDHDRPRG